MYNFKILLIKITKRETLLTHPVKGALFENMMVAEFFKQMHHSYQNQSPFFWRDNHGDEVDLLLDNGTTLDIFEIKASETILTENFKGMEKFESISTIPLSSKGLIYAGSLNQKRSYGNVISWRDFPIFS